MCHQKSVSHLNDGKERLLVSQNSLAVGDLGDLRHRWLYCIVFALILSHLSHGQRAKLRRYMVKKNTPQPSWIRIRVYSIMCACVCVNVVHIVVFYQCRYSVFVPFYLPASALWTSDTFRLKERGREKERDKRSRLPLRCVYGCLAVYIAYKSIQTMVYAKQNVKKNIPVIALFVWSI